MMHFVEQIVDVQPYRLVLKFSSGELRWVNLEPILKAKATSPESAFRRLLDPAVFSQVRLDQGARTIYWEGLARSVAADGTEESAPLDFCPDVLYDLSAPVSEEVSLERISLILNDGPQEPRQ
jgi:Protein of unknown function (DUF2442)